MHNLACALTTTIALVIASISAAQPNIDYLCNDDIELLWPQPSIPIWTDFDINKPNQSFIVLVGDSEDPNPDKTWAVWNDPAVAEYIKQEGYTVIFTHDNERSRMLTEDALHNGPINRVAITHKMFVQPLRDWSKSQWPSIKPTPQQLINWLSNPKQFIEKREHQQRRLLNSIANNPDELWSRFALMDMHQSLGGYALFKHKLEPWLLVHSELWYIHERQASKNRTNEIEFRLIIFEMIRTAREELNLFGTISESQTGTVYNKWIRLEYQASRGFHAGVVLPHKSIRWQWANILKPHYIDADPETLTDREQFILKALTAEGQEWQQLKEQYQIPDE